MPSDNPIHTTTRTAWETTKGMFQELKKQGIARYTLLKTFLWFTAAMLVLGIYYYYRYQMKKGAIRS